MRYKILFFAFLFIFTAVYGFSQEENDWFVGRPIRDIVFSGINNVSLSELDALMQPFRGRIYDDDVYIEILTRLFALDFFANIEASIVRADPAGNESIIRFIVTEHPIIRRINFSGNSAMRRIELLDTINTRVNDFHNPARIRGDVEAIRNRYIERGFPDVVITVSEIPSGDTEINLVFVISEGSRITIRNIDFQGNTVFSDRALRGQISHRPRSLFQDGAFQEAGLIADIQAIQRFYHDRGFIDAVVRDVTRTIETDDRGSNMTLTFYIDEGSLYTFGGVTFEGNVIFSDAQLGRLINSRVGDTVNFSRVMADLQRVSDLYFENGYIFNTINRVENRDTQNNVLSYNIFIIERGRAYIENIIIRGNDKTRTDVILREIPLMPGDVFSRTRVLDAMRNLHNLRFFSMIIPDTVPGSTENLMELIFTVEEQPTTDIQIGATFSGSADPDTFPISGMVRWNDINLAGTGNQLGVELSSSVVDTTTFSVNYLHRWIFGLPLSGGFDLSVVYSRRLALMTHPDFVFRGDEAYAFPAGFESREEWDSNRSPPREYLMNFEQWHLSLGLNTGYRWNTFLGIFGLGGGVRFGILRTLYDENLYRPFDPVLRDRNNQWTPRNSFWTTVSLDRRDIFFDPSRGYFFSNRFGVFGLFPEETEHYLRNDFRAQYFLTLFSIPVTERWAFRAVLAMQGAISTIWRQPDLWGRELRIADANMLAVDGMFVGRGWNDQFQHKGLLLLDNWVELRFPLVPRILALDLFFDAAAVDSQPDGQYFDGFGLTNWRFGFGGGLRFTLQQFPFRLSIARNFRYHGDDGSDGLSGWNWNQRNQLFGVEGLTLVISFVITN